MSAFGGLKQRVRDVWGRLTWSIEKSRTAVCRAGGHRFEVTAPTRRQLDVMRGTVLTDKYLSDLKVYFDQIGVRPGQDVLDIGANIGYMALAYAVMLPGSRIQAFEPSPQNYGYLVSNTLNFPSIVPQSVGLHHERARCTLRMPSESQNARMNSSEYRNPGLLSLYGEGEVISADVELLPLDEWVKGYDRRDRIGFIKIDVEGNELNVLRGAKAFLAQHGPAVEVEANPATLSMTGETRKHLVDFFAELGYGAWFFDGTRLVGAASAPEGCVNMVFLKK